MAFLPQGQQDPNNPQGQQQNQIPQVPLIPSFQGSGGGSAGAGAGFGGGGRGGPAAAPSAPWANVSSYLAANAGQAGSVADVLSNRLTNQYNTANQGIGQAQTNFGQQIESARVPYQQSVADAAKASPSQFAQDPQNVAAFQKMYNANYAGPQSFSQSQDYSDLAAKVQGAQKQAGLLNQGTSGLMTLLQQAEAAGGRNPTQGVTALDSLLLQEAPENFSKLKQAATPFAGLTDYLSQTQGALDTQAQNAAVEAANTKQNLQNQYLGPEGIIPSFQNKLSQDLQGASQKVTNYNKTIADIIADLNQGKGLTDFYPNYILGNVDPSGVLNAINPYGMSGGVFQNMKAQGFVNPGYLTQFYDAPELLNQPGIENVMTPQQLADAQALNQLTGMQAIATPAALGSPLNVPTTFGGFRGQEAMQSLFDSLKGMEANLPNMSPTEQQAWMADITKLSQLMGIDTAYQGPGQPPTPTPPTTPPPDPMHPIDGGDGNWLGFV